MSEVGIRNGRASSAIIATLLTLNFFCLYILSLVLNRGLTSYILFLLLCDTFCSKQIASFPEYIRDLNGATPGDEHTSCRCAFEKMARSLDKTKPWLGLTAGASAGEGRWHANDLTVRWSELERPFKGALILI